MKFFYQARTKEGEIQTGFIEAPSKEAALSVLQKYDLYVTLLSEEKQPLWRRKIQIFSKFGKANTAALTRQLAIMLKSNIPVTESLETLAQQQKRVELREKILAIAEGVESGATLSKALAEHPKLFPPFYIGMVRAGEITGNIPESLDYLADYLEKEREFAGKILSATIYPMFVLIVFFVILTVMAFYVIPKFAEVFSESGIKLPWLTRIIIFIGLFLSKHWIPSLVLLVVFIMGLVIFLKSEQGRKLLNKVSLEVPLVNDFVKKIYLARTSLTLSTLIAGGLPITQAVEITGNVVGNDAYKEAILQIRDGIKGGKKISDIARTYPELFSPLFLQMITVGEKTGHIEKTLANVFTFYNKEIDRALSIIPMVLEPLLIIFLGGLVLIVALAIFLPLSQRGFMF